MTTQSHTTKQTSSSSTRLNVQGESPVLSEALCWATFKIDNKAAMLRDNVQFVSPVHQKVAGLHVPVNHAMTVHRLERDEQIFHVATHFFDSDIANVVLKSINK